MCDVGFAIFFFNITNDFAASFLTEVDIYIGRFESALVEESFEEQVVFDWAYVRQISCVAYEGTNTASSCRRRNVDFACMANKVPNDEEVV